MTTAAAPQTPETPADAEPAGEALDLNLNQLDEEIAEALQPERLRSLYDQASAWAETHLLAPEAGIQLGLTALALILAFILARSFAGAADRLFRPISGRRFAVGARRVFDSLARPILALVLLLIVQAGLLAAGAPAYMPRIAVSLTLAWIAIRLVSHLIAEPFWARVVALIAWVLAALNIFGLLGPTAAVLDSIGFPMGDARFSVLTFMRGIVIAALLFWLAIWLSGLARGRIDRLPGLTPSVRLLLAKVLQIVLMGVAFMFALSGMGIDPTALAVFSGAIGLGIGFGLQKIFSNLVSGVILLLDRSIKPGDVIQVDDTYGYVKTLGLRYSSVVTRDNHEHLIPNEEFIINKVVNWSFSEVAVRLKKKVGIAYSSDVRLAQKLMLQAAGSIERVLSHPKPVCQLNEFGDNAVVLEIRFWISDPQNGVNNVISDVQFAIWDLFHEHGVEFPFPQRDIHLKAPDPLVVRVADAEEWEAMKRAKADAERQRADAAGEVELAGKSESELADDSGGMPPPDSPKE